MLKKKIISMALAALCCSFVLSAQEGPQKPDPEELAEKETERLEGLLKLEDWQVFYVDSTLRYNMTEMFAELEKLQRSRVENTDIYLGVQDKWTERTQDTYKRIFSEEQWAQYLKQGGLRIIRDREKRRQKYMDKKK